MAGGADRLACGRHAADVQPRDAFLADLDHRREVIERGRDQLANAGGGFFVWQDEWRPGAEVLVLSQRHARHHAERQRLLRRRDHMLGPAPDDDWSPVEVRPPRRLQATGQTPADMPAPTSWPS